MENMEADYSNKASTKENEDNKVCINDTECPNQM